MKIRALIITMVLVSWPQIINAQSSFPENFEIRQKYNKIMTAPIADILDETAFVYEQIGSPHRVKFDLKQQAGSVYFLFLNEMDYKFPVYSRGSYVVKRDEKTGEFLQVKIFLQSDEGTFLRIYPSHERTFMDIYLRGKMLYEGINLSLSFQDVLKYPFYSLQLNSDSLIDWNNLVPQPGRFPERLQNVISSIAKALPSLGDAEDGAMDENGQFVFIESLSDQDEGPGFNCSGFAKWIADGFYKPIWGRLMNIEGLKTKHLESRGNTWSRTRENRDPYFGLDWTRNIALTLGSLTGKPDFENPEKYDVRDIPFINYVEDVGYSIDDLDFALYIQAIKDPGNIYWGSVNKEFGTAPVLRQHIHVAIFIPWFDEDGNYHVEVFERNHKTSIKSLKSRYEGAFVHLTYSKVPADFSLPIVE
ncbi:hypothetical protein [Spirochaeta cellobiosiphila]|uniref:hypothetical protein n=1 Tax=Spirochaeta cellobiosiphila TaxID=504483 RepID=UPI00040A340E|nr:hypothetical protein [Spirochaeta cellobiosiphila]